MRQRNSAKQTGSALAYALVVFVLIAAIGAGVWVWRAQSRSSDGNNHKNQSDSSDTEASATSKPLTSGSDNASLTADIANINASVSEGAQNLQSATEAVNDESKVIDVPVDSTQLRPLKSAANAEIDRRMANLGRLAKTIGGDTRLRSGDRSKLKNTVNNELSELKAIKNTLATDNSVGLARIDAQALINDYYRYSFIVAKVWMLRVADDQQVVEDKFNTLSGKLQTRINQAQAGGSDVSGLQASLNEVLAKADLSQKHSKVVAQKLLQLETTDYTNDHATLNAQLGNLKAAQESNLAAQAAANTTVQGIIVL